MRTMFMYIQSIAQHDPELWYFPAVYRALEDREVSPEEFRSLLLDEMRLMRDCNEQSVGFFGLVRRYCPRKFDCLWAS